MATDTVPVAVTTPVLSAPEVRRDVTVAVLTTIFDPETVPAVLTEPSTRELPPTVMSPVVVIPPVAVSALVTDSVLAVMPVAALNEPVDIMFVTMTVFAVSVPAVDTDEAVMGPADVSDPTVAVPMVEIAAAVTGALTEIPPPEVIAPVTLISPA